MIVTNNIYCVSDSSACGIFDAIVMADSVFAAKNQVRKYLSEGHLDYCHVDEDTVLDAKLLLSNVSYDWDILNDNSSYPILNVSVYQT